MEKITDGRKYMERMSECRRRIRLLKEAIERERTLAEGVGAIRYDKENVQTPVIQDRMTDIVARIIEKTNELEEEIKKLQEYEKESREILLLLPEAYERTLCLHYLENKNWAEVAVAMNYDDKYIYIMRNKALAELTEKLKTTDQNKRKAKTKVLK